MREEGNELFRKCTREGLAPSIAEVRLGEAVALYRSAAAAAASCDEELAELASASKNQGVAVAKLVVMKSVSAHGGVRATIAIAAEAIRAFAVASSAGVRVGKDADWLTGIGTNADTVVAVAAANLLSVAVDIETAAMNLQLLANAVAGEGRGGGALFSASRAAPVFNTCLASALDGSSADWFAPLAARLHLAAARKLLQAVVAFTEEAGAISRSEAEALRERAAERRAAPARADSFVGDEQYQEDSDGNDSDGDDVDDDEEVRAVGARSLAETRTAESHAIRVGLPMLSEAQPHIATAERFARATYSKRLQQIILDEISELVGDLSVQAGVLQARQLRIDAEIMLKTALDDAEEIEMTAVMCALDNYKASARAASGIDLESEAIAEAGMGLIIGKIIKNEDRAYSHYMNALALAAAASPRSFISTRWYQDARTFIQAVQAVRQSAEKFIAETIESDLLKDQKAVCDEIDRASKKGAAELLLHINKHHRAKVNGEDVPELMKDAVKGDFVVGTLRAAIRLCEFGVVAASSDAPLIRLNGGTDPITLSAHSTDHPDRVTARHTPASQALASFICKRLSEIYAVIGAC